MQSKWTEENLSNQYFVWPHFAFKTSSTLLGTLAHSFWALLAQTSWRINHSSSVALGQPQLLLSLHLSRDRLDDVGIRILWGHYITSRTPCSSSCWRWFLMTFSACLGSLSCCRRNLGLINCLPGDIAWWISICLQHWGHSRFWPNPHSICRNTAPNLQGTSTMLHCYL